MATHSHILAWEIPWTEDPDYRVIVLAIVHGAAKELDKETKYQNGSSRDAGCLL